MLVGDLPRVSWSRTSGAPTTTGTVPEVCESPEPLVATSITHSDVPVDASASPAKLMLTSTLPLAVPPLTDAIVVFGLPPSPPLLQNTDPSVS